MSLMFLLIWRFITFLLAALTLAMAFCHLLEMSPKMKYDAALYTTVQQTVYRNFGVPLGAAIETGAVIFTIVLATLNRKGGSAFYLTAITASCYVVAFAHLVRTRVTHQCRNQRVDDHVRASELDAVAQSVGAGARSTRRSLSGRI
jgi:hypothetical protein